ncbi:MAG: hypothetical protein FWC40_04560 [Proteobacteria bacterium]|nr:hypothetical protein [Pseudomonadota bacterium]
MGWHVEAEDVLPLHMALFLLDACGTYRYIVHLRSWFVDGCLFFSVTMANK